MSFSPLPACSHHWTVTSECPKCLRSELLRTYAELLRAYAEIRKQVFGSGVVFDREVVERAEGRENYEEEK